MLISPLAFERMFDPADWQRGRVSARSGKCEVTLVRHDAGHLVLRGQVRGSRPSPYRCELLAERRGEDSLNVDSQCECGAVRCKHAAAMLQAFAAQQRLESRANNPSMQQFKQALLQAAEDVFSVPDQAPPLVILVRAHEYDGCPSFHVRPFIAHGSLPWQEWVPERRAHIDTSALALPAQRLLERLASIEPQMLQGRPWWPWPQRVRVEDLLLWARLHWERPGQAAMVQGAALDLHWHWQVAQDGVQQLDVRTTQSSVLAWAGDQALYFDAESGSLGAVVNSSLRLRAHELRGLLTQLGRAPKVPALEPQAYWQEHRQQWPRHAPAPRTYPVTWLSKPPVPLLKLGMRADRQALLERALRRRLGLAELAFSDQEGAFTAEQYQHGLLRLDGERLVGYQFDVKHFEHTVRALEREGFMLAEGLLRDESLPEYCFALNPDFDESTLQQACLISIPRLRKAGFTIQYSNDFPISLTAAQARWITVVEDQGDVFDLELRIELDGEEVSLLPVLKQAIEQGLKDQIPGNPEARVAIALPDGRRVSIAAGRLRMLLGALGELEGLRNGRLTVPRARAQLLEDIDQALSNEESSRIGTAPLEALAAQLTHASPWPQIDVPSTMRAKLRPYQQQGVNWLGMLAQQGLSGVLADDMGLGKTVQVLAHLLALVANGRLSRPVLVIAPSSVVPNWQAELKRFAPSLSVTLLGQSGKRQKLDPEAQIWLSSYAYLGRHGQKMLQQPFSWVVLDEAQQVKNPNTLAAKMVRKLHATHRLCLTGTPLENHLGELWAQFDFVLPGLLGTRMQFQRQFRVPIERRRDPAAQMQLGKRIAPFMLRRSKDQVLTELPPKTEIIRRVELGGRQREIYELLRLDYLGRLKSLRERKPGEARMMLLDALTRLRQACCDPRLLALEHTQHTRDSAKLVMLLGMIEELLREGRKILLFSQFTSMLDLISEELRARKIQYLTLTGETVDRAAPVEAFQRGQAPIFLLSLRAGGVGINLTAADTVIHYDPWWNPAVEDQATDRAYRMGQDKPVFVYKLVTMDSVEERVEALKARKRELLDQIFAGTGQIGPNEDDMLQLLGDEPLPAD